MKLVVSVQSHDNLNELKGWIEESFSIIENKYLGLQDYSKIDAYGRKESQAVGTLPYAGNEHEMIVMESLSDSNSMFLIFCIPHGN